MLVVGRHFRTLIRGRLERPEGGCDFRCKAAMPLANDGCRPSVNFGGVAPLAAQARIDITGSNLPPGYYMVVTAAISLLALIALRRRYKV
jgi:hypothetical protein